MDKEQFVFNEITAYQAMFSFLERHYHEINKPEVLGNLLGDMELFLKKDEASASVRADTSDSAMWQEWHEAIETVKNLYKQNRGQ